MKASDFVARYVEARGVTHVFELVGGMITHLLHSFSTSSRIDIVSCHHEQAAAFAAEGYARICGVPGIALATSGPGATNLLTAIGSCYFDSTPAVFITGQVNTHELKGDLGIRQLGFQETDIIAIARPLCKSAIQVRNVADLPAALEEAFDCALSGRQGPCLLDLPMNVQSDALDDLVADQWLAKARLSSDSASTPSLGSISLSSEQLTCEFRSLLEAIELAERPLLLVGGGCASVPNRPAAQKIIDILRVPVVHSLMAVDLLPASHPLRVGFIGSYGNRWANKALAASDLLIVLGSRLDIRQTGSDLQSFCQGKQIWQIDIDKAEIGVRVQPQHSICCSIRSAAELLATLAAPKEVHHRSWFEQIASLRSQYPAVIEYDAESGDINPVQLLQELSRLASAPCSYITDVGQHQMWAAQALDFGSSDRFITSGGMGAMGFGLPAAIGAAFARQDRMVVLISGDGSFQLNIQELETVRRNNLDLKIIVFNNHCHGMVRQFQESYFDGKLQSTVEGYSAPDFVAICEAYRISARHLDAASALDDALSWLLAAKGPALLEVPLSVRSKVYPKLAFGRPFGDMEPDIAPVAMEST
jgi:acetolactate synthase-1/2/3 large subunit